MRPTAGQPRIHPSVESRAKNACRRFSPDREGAILSGCLAFTETAGRREVPFGRGTRPATGPMLQPMRLTVDAETARRRSPAQ